ncbi:MAG TPA: alpha/beta fold hydrolase [Gemmatimonadaceae bacterium]|jgi:Lysophospholipase
MLQSITLPSGITATTITAAQTGSATAGERAPLLFVHGMFGGAWQFAEWQRHLAMMGYSSVAIDLRGHNGSRPVADIGKVSTHEYVEDAMTTARTMGKPVVVGHSMGGLIAQKLAEAGAVSAAVLLCSAPPKGISIASAALLIRQVKHASAILLSRPLLPDRSDAEALVLNHVPPSERDALLERMVPESGRAAREMSLGAIAVDEQRVHCPVLSAGAGDDRFLPPRISRALAKKYGAEHREYAGHGHYIVGEPGWERVADDLADWISAQGQSLNARTSPSPAPPR